MENHFVIRGIISLERGTFIELLRGENRDTALVFVHGYNTSFDDGAFRLAQIWYDGQLSNSIPVLFSWPSKNNLTEYIYDENMADAADEYFIELLEILRKEAGINTVHIIAHSMGNRIVLNAVRKAVDTLNARPLGEIVFAAADVYTEKFRQDIKAVGNISHGMTLYASAADAALYWSRWAASSERAGTVRKDGPVLAEGVESIDMTSTNSDGWTQSISRNDLLGLNTHNTFVNPVIDDIARLVKKGEHPPPSRTSAIRGVPEDTPIPKYWRFAE